MTTCCHSLFSCCHLLSFVVTRCHSLPLVVILCHSLSLVVPLVATRCTTRCHSLSLDVSLVCLFINDLAYFLKCTIIFCKQQNHSENRKRAFCFVLLFLKTNFKVMVCLKRKVKGAETTCVRIATEMKECSKLKETSNFNVL